MDARELERFMSHVDTNVGPLDCWLWTGSLRNGYGQFRFRGTIHYAHRVMFHHLFGYWSTELDHFKCGDIRCVRHTEDVTHRINMLRSPVTASGANARKTTCPKGHLYDEIDYRGGRGCSECRRESHRRDYRRHREQRIAQAKKYAKDRKQQRTEPKAGGR